LTALKVQKETSTAPPTYNALIPISLTSVASMLI